ISLRRAERTDLDAVVAIERVSFSDPPWSRDSFAALVDSPRAYFTVACEAPTEAVVGYVVAWFVVDEAEIANLAVAPDRRGRGVGSRLPDAALLQPPPPSRVPPTPPPAKPAPLSSTSKSATPTPPPVPYTTLAALKPSAGGAAT